MSDIDVLTMKKQPADRITRAVDFTDRMLTGVTISSATVALIDTETREGLSASMLASTTGTISGKTVSFIALGGTDGRQYKITVTATLSSGDILTADILLSVKEY